MFSKIPDGAEVLAHYQQLWSLMTEPLSPVACYWRIKVLPAAIENMVWMSINADSTDFSGRR